MKRESDPNKKCLVKRSGAQCGLTEGHDGFHLFFCAGQHCPGYPIPATEMSHPNSCVTDYRDAMDNDDLNGAVYKNCLEILSRFPKPGTEIFDCPLCGKQVQELFTAREIDADQRITYEVCSDCYTEIEGKPADHLTGRTINLEIKMDYRMCATLEQQSNIEGYADFSRYIHAILFREAVRSWLDDLADPETEEEQIAFVKEIRDWLYNV